jgi:hypothetical protein
LSAPGPSRRWFASKVWGLLTKRCPRSAVECPPYGRRQLAAARALRGWAILPLATLITATPPPATCGDCRTVRHAGPQYKYVCGVCHIKPWHDRICTSLVTAVVRQSMSASALRETARTFKPNHCCRLGVSEARSIDLLEHCCRPRPYTSLGHFLSMSLVQCRQRITTL